MNDWEKKNWITEILNKWLFYFDFAYWNLAKTKNSTKYQQKNKSITVLKVFKQRK